MRQKDGTSQSEAAGKLSVSVKSVERAASVKATDPELFDQVKRGEVSVTVAAEQVKPTKKNEVPAGYYRPITNDEVREMFEKTLPEVKEWLTAYKDLKPKTKKEAYSLFLNLTALGDLS